MRQLSGYALKHEAGYKKAKRNLKIQTVPREGSRLREIYDFFLANPGEKLLIPAAWGKSWKDHLDGLINYYGLDIRHAGIKGHYWLVGEFRGNHYIDYVAEKYHARFRKKDD